MSDPDISHARGARTHEQHGDDAPSHGTRRSYLIGFALSVVLTAIPFWLVMSGVVADTRVTAFLVAGFAIVQIIVHMIYFLHMDTRSEAGWTMLALIFTVVIVVIAVAGTLWVMFHLNANMMPQMDSAMNMTNMGADAM